MSLPTNLYKKKRTSNFFSIVFLIIVLFSTGVLYLYNKKLSLDIGETQDNINKVDLLIKNIKKDKKLQVYTLMESNKKSLEKLEYFSQIPNYIEHYKTIGQKYKLNFKNFNYSGGKLTTSVFVDNKNEITYLRVVNFLKKYRQDSDALFTLGFVNSLKGNNNNLEFSISLELKDLDKKGNTFLKKIRYK